jgi:ABC-2 type transport system ATP-binding protein
VQAEFQDLVQEVRDAGSTVFLSSHILSEVQHVADHVIIIRRGKVVSAGSVDELRVAARQPFLVWFADEPAAAAAARELRAATGVAAIEARGREVEGVVEGSPTPLLRVLARHPVERLLVPEPDLEDAFLRLYEEDR